MSENRNSGEQFLNEKYPDLQHSAELEGALKRQRIRTGEKPKNKNEKVGAYLKRLNEIFNPEEKDTDKKEFRVDFLKDKLHEKLVIKEEDIPEGYFENQQRIAREQGHGDIHITAEMRSEAAKVIINDQEQSLDSWVDYLGSDDAMYPDWLKYWVFRSISQLSSYDKKTKAFKKRSKGTTTQFPDINREALAYVLDAVQKQQGGVLPEADGKKWEELLKTKNFAKLYAHAIEKCTPASEEETQKIEGKWATYNQSENPEDAEPLYESLQGHGTGWCTAGQSTAEAQLKMGDFHVFYTKDKNDQYKVPRIAIRMQEGEIAEVRGINQDQELEPVLIDTAREKMQTLPGGNKYEKKVNDMKRVTELEMKKGRGEEFTKEDLRFFYGMDGRIEGFGYRDDPRLRKLLKRTDTGKHLSIIFDCPMENIVLDADHADDETILLSGSFLASFTSLKLMPKNLKYIMGNVDLHNSPIEDLVELCYVGGSLKLGKSKIKSLGKLKVIHGDVDFTDSEIEDLGSLEEIRGNVYIDHGSHLDFNKIKIGGTINGRSIEDNQ